MIKIRVGRVEIPGYRLFEVEREPRILARFPFINNYVYTYQMKYSEFRKWLTQQGAVLKSAKGSHFKVYLGGRQTIFPDHGAKEIGQGLVQKIKKDLGLK